MGDREGSFTLFYTSDFVWRVQSLLQNDFKYKGSCIGAGWLW